MPRFKVEKKVRDTRNLRVPLIGMAGAMFAFDLIKNGEGAIPFYDDWGLSEWSLVPTAIAYLLKFVGIRIETIKITEIKD